MFLSHNNVVFIIKSKPEYFGCHGYIVGWIPEFFSCLGYIVSCGYPTRTHTHTMYVCIIIDYYNDNNKA